MVEHTKEEKSKGSPGKGIELGQHEDNVVLGQDGNELNVFNKDNNYMYAIPQ
ncbi:nitrate ABC transporter substrate-binding protein, partial [Staphylococcus pseudintermedius]